MPRSASERTVLAAAVLDAYLRDRPRLPVQGTPRPADDDPSDATLDPPSPAAGTRAELPGAVGAGIRPGGPSDGAPLRLPHPDWLLHNLTVAGSDDGLAAFRTAAAAAGAGVVPWQLDVDRMQEDFFHHLARAGQLSLHGAEVLAGQLRAAVAQRHALAVARVGHSLACPFDLHALVPVPEPVLRLGPDHPDALAWLWTRWGTTEALRHVTVVDGADRRTKKAKGPAVLKLRFWSADWTPWRALETIRAEWPGLRFDLRPHYGLD